MMIYGSVCSGIEAASVAWHPLGWRAAFLSEIEAFPRAVLTHHYPTVPLHGDFTTIEADQYEPIDLLVGGTPCQSFSVAGLRGGLADDRGNLALEFLKLAQRLRPRWIVWENVPGVLSSTSHIAPDPSPPEAPMDLECDGAEMDTEDEYDSEELHAFNCLLAGFSELGYGWSYRVLDAQFFGVPQRRRRIFAVGYLGDWRPAAAVLFERHSLSGDFAPRRETRKDVAPTISARTKGGGGLGTDFDLDGGLIAKCLSASHTASGRQDPSAETYVTHSLRAEGFDASEDGTGRGTPLVPVAYRVSPNCGAWETGERTDAMTTGTDRTSSIIAFSSKDHGGDAGDISPTLRSMSHDGSHANAGGQVAIAIQEIGKRTGKSTTDIRAGIGIANEGDPMFTLQSGAQHGVCAFQQSQSGIREVDTHATLDANNGSRRASGALVGSAVRRLTPRECERLQGFPDDYTLIPYRGKHAADGPRYRALGNSMAVPVMAWIGRRIEAVNAILTQRSAAA